MKKILSTISITMLVVMAALLNVKALQYEEENAYAYEARGESGYVPSHCHQNLGYCTGSGAGLSFKCIGNTTGETCTRHHCTENC